MITVALNMPRAPPHASSASRTWPTPGARRRGDVLPTCRDTGWRRVGDAERRKNGGSANRRYHAAGALVGSGIAGVDEAAMRSVCSATRQVRKEIRDDRTT